MKWNLSVTMMCWPKLPPNIATFYQSLFWRFPSASFLTPSAVLNQEVSLSAAAPATPSNGSQAANYVLNFCKFIVYSQFLSSFAKQKNYSLAHLFPTQEACHLPFLADLLQCKTWKHKPVLCCVKCFWFSSSSEQCDACDHPACCSG